MKKVYVFLFLAFSFLGISNVKADTNYSVNYSIDTPSGFNSMSYTEIRQFFDSYSSVINSMFTDLITAYSNYSEQYPYYWVYLDYRDDISPNILHLRIYGYNSIQTLSTQSSVNSLSYSISNEWCNYNFTTNQYSNCDYVRSLSGTTVLFDGFASHRFYANSYFFSNFDLRFSGITQDDIAYESSGFNGVKDFLRPSSSPIPSLYNFFELTFLNNYVNDVYTTVDLDDYSYLILSFKDYSNLISPITFQVKGQFCITTAYDYGQQPKETVTDRCSVVYDDFTPVRIWTSASDLSRNVVYYLKAYDTTIDNVVKINTSLFNIAYITSIDESEPVIYVGGRPYSPIPYDNLPSTATGNESDNFIPGATCGIGDVDCVYETGGIDFADLFTHPLQLLQTVWGSISNMFILITAFISLLPSTLQVFLYSSFMLAILLGLIKMIL